MTGWGLVGDGAWGMALARRLAANGHSVTVVGESAYPWRLSKDICHTLDLPEVLLRHERLLIALPIDALEPFLSEAAPYLRGDHRIVSTCRGLTPAAHLRGTEAISRLTPVRQLAVLAGAADADALKRKSPVALVVGTPFAVWGSEVQKALSSSSLRVYTNSDLVGVELANVVAAVVGVALGVARALSVGPAAEATALTRALAEMDRLVGGLGGETGTAFGLAGLGVLGEMAYDGTGNSFKAGAALARGELEEAHLFTEVREASRTLAMRVAREHLRAPLVKSVFSMMEEAATPEDALADLMHRPVGPEEG